MKAIEIAQQMAALEATDNINADVKHSLRNSKIWNIALAILFACAVAAAIVF